MIPGKKSSSRRAAAAKIEEERVPRKPLQDGAEVLPSRGIAAAAIPNPGAEEWTPAKRSPEGESWLRQAMGHPPDQRSGPVGTKDLRPRSPARICSSPQESTMVRPLRFQRSARPGAGRFPYAAGLERNAGRPPTRLSRCRSDRV